LEKEKQAILKKIQKGILIAKDNGIKFTSSILSLSWIKLSFENALKVPPIVTESGITLNAPPPWNLETVTTCKFMRFYLFI
jgi:hypothetical protein